MRIAYLTAAKNGMSWYRIEQPMRALNDLGLASTMEVNQGNTGVTATAELFLVPGHIATIDRCEFMKEGGAKLVLDFCDDPFETDPMSPSYVVWGLKEVFARVGEEILPLWKKGVAGFDPDKNFDRHQELKRCLGIADLVTVTTDILAERFRPYTDKIRVLPDCIDLKRWRKLPLMPHDTINLHWGGGESHFEDLRLIVDPLKKIFDEYPQVRLTLMGPRFAEFVALKFGQYLDRIEVLPWVNACCYPLILATRAIDIGLVPLRGNEFDSAKSPLKVLEMGALGVPCVVSGVHPYIDIYDGQNMALVGGNTQEGWHAAISHLIDSPGDRKNIGLSAESTVIDKYNLEVNAAMWVEAYRELFQREVANGDQYDDKVNAG